MHNAATMRSAQALGPDCTVRATIARALLPKGCFVLEAGTIVKQHGASVDDGRARVTVTLTRRCEGRRSMFLLLLPFAGSTA